MLLAGAIAGGQGFKSASGCYSGVIPGNWSDFAWP